MTDNERAAYNEGRDAAKAGLPASHNPYTFEIYRHQWYEGWSQYTAETTGVTHELP